MVKNYALVFMTMLCCALNAQISITYDSEYITDSQSVLDASSINNLGFLGPKVELFDIYDIESIDSPEMGLVVYNTTYLELNGEVVLKPGYYSYNGTKWVSFVSGASSKEIDNSNFSVSTLGYFPNGKFSSAPNTFTYNGVTATKTKCIFQEFSKESYCSYDIRRDGQLAGINWNTAFNMAKEIGGHLPVINTNSELEILKNNFFHIDNQAQSRYKSAWIGFRSYALPGETEQFGWITGEVSAIEWNSGQFSNKFEDKRPAELGCGLYTVDRLNINREQQGAETIFTDRYWDLTSCSNTTSRRILTNPNTEENISYLIVEFLKN